MELKEIKNPSERFQWIIDTYYNGSTPKFVASTKIASNTAYAIIRGMQANISDLVVEKVMKALPELPPLWIKKGIDTKFNESDKKTIKDLENQLFIAKVRIEKLEKIISVLLEDK